jgi:hypothetical protein
MARGLKQVRIATAGHALAVKVGAGDTAASDAF